jgi:hypothetical protein
MIRRKLLRLRVPISTTVLGSALAVAVGVSRGWSAAFGIEVVVFLIAAYVYMMGHNDSDTGAVLGSRTDERQTIVRLRAQALAMRVMYVAALIAWAVAIALKGLYWPFDLIFSLGGVSFLVGIQIYGVREDSSFDALPDASREPGGSLTG